MESLPLDVAVHAIRRARSENFQNVHRMLAVLGAVAFNQEWKGLATLMSHYEKYGEDGSPEEANRLLGAPKVTLEAWLKVQKWG